MTIADDARRLATLAGAVDRVQDRLVAISDTMDTVDTDTARILGTGHRAAAVNHAIEEAEPVSATSMPSWTWFPGTSPT
ncbi:hypothetical protein [Actinokineospora iranica]|uniref:hypothetical protein n=1 Tax=Actinokineospora iranica TaxID=1271860 RepID=UPI000B8A1D51|nr:hypothetical protein [Actinokineospora iranica]